MFLLVTNLVILDLNPCIKDAYFVNNWSAAGQKAAKNTLNRIVSIQHLKCYLGLPVMENNNKISTMCTSCVRQWRQVLKL
jgi:hypothetical protein